MFDALLAPPLTPPQTDNSHGNVAREGNSLPPRFVGDCEISIARKKRIKLSQNPPPACLAFVTASRPSVSLAAVIEPRQIGFGPSTIGLAMSRRGPQQ